jgi:hypothetical protein
MNKQNDQSREGRAVLSVRSQNVLAASVSEFLFVVLPLIVITIIFWHNNRESEIMASPECSFGASVLFGNGLVKLVGGLSARGGMHGERVGLFCAIILVLGLVPSLVVLSLILLSEHPSSGLIRAQELLGVFAVVAFFFCADMGSLPRESEKNA